MPLVTPDLLRGYKVDRAPGMTADGPTELVVLILQGHNDPKERPYAISKADAMMIGHLLVEAATDAQSVMHKKI